MRFWWQYQRLKESQQKNWVGGCEIEGIEGCLQMLVVCNMLYLPCSWRCVAIYPNPWPINSVETQLLTWDSIWYQAGIFGHAPQCLMSWHRTHSDIKYVYIYIFFLLSWLSLGGASTSLHLSSSLYLSSWCYSVSPFLFVAWWSSPRLASNKWVKSPMVAIEITSANSSVHRNRQVNKITKLTTFTWVINEITISKT